MAHFAELNTDNVVVRVIAVNNNELLDADGVEQEAIGAEFCRSLFGGTWVQTSYNAKTRKNFAVAGATYDSDRGVFIPPQPHPSWALNETTYRWEAPTEYPTDGNFYQWDEETTAWVEVAPNE